MKQIASGLFPGANKNIIVQYFVDFLLEVIYRDGYQLWWPWYRVRKKKKKEIPG